ncbi:homeodomain-interacting protein kinase 2-like [Takifugu rubripes]|uniref:homeodomain-interacting protein kinase 2-like n=1 Tax=Takifugu rubripes TaxID=31033 RepID=UPI001145E7BC|nr:homeodomain-interacting protein kinase 2-like [Takifugu rubripes]
MKLCEIWNSNLVRVGDTLSSPIADYVILRSLGSGVYGEVVRCINLNTNKIVAVKILKNINAFTEAQREILFLQICNSLNHPNIIRLFEEFTFKGCDCLVFELLHRDLQHTIAVYPNDMPLCTIRPIAKQLFMALEALNTVGVIHTDIKLDNIMFVKWYDLRIKVIDFGLAIRDTNIIVGKKLQALGYRSPEILLGLPYTNTIDMWSAGCVLAHLFLQTSLFEVHSEYEMMRQVVQLLGQPEDRLLRTGIYTEKYFTVMEGADGPMWRLKTPEEYNGEKNAKKVMDSTFKSLDDLVDIHSFETIDEYEDFHVFVDLLKLMLHIDGNRRISASEALNHPFITMSHLSNPRYQNYFNDAERFMRCCTVLNLVPDDQQNDNAETLQPREIDWQQCEDVEERMEMQRSENITWQTAKEESNTCEYTRFELPSETRQQREDGTKAQHHSALFFSSRNKITKGLSKFQKNVKAWFTNGGSPPHYR